jgi:polysaccharide biosynthesis/export protein
VPNRKLVYLQKDDVERRDHIVADTVVRVHRLNIEEYRIQPLDVLSITFKTLTSEESEDFDFLSQLSTANRSGSQGGGGSSGGGSSSNSGSLINGTIVNPQGEVEYAILGKIKVGGLTIFEAQDTLQALASKYLRDVVVRVRMMNFRFTVLGEVNTENTVVSLNPRVTMMEAVGLSGGFGELADRAHVKVLRQYGDRTEVFYVNLLEEKYIESPFYYVHQNDIIIVPPLKQRPFRRYFAPNLALATAVLSTILFIVSVAK